MKTISFICLFIVAISGQVMAQKWESLGHRKVNFGLDHDEIMAGGQGVFTAIQIQVTDGGINMHKCVIHFKNGDEQEVELRHNFAPGSDSRVVDLVGNKRHIVKISFWYDTKDLSYKKATLEVLGRR